MPSSSNSTNSSSSVPSPAMKTKSKTPTTVNETQSHGAQDIQAMTARVKLLNDLYFADGRDNPDHPLRGTYTGLYQAHLAK